MIFCLTSAAAIFFTHRHVHPLEACPGRCTRIHFSPLPFSTHPSCDRRVTDRDLTRKSYSQYTSALASVIRLGACTVHAAVTVDMCRSPIFSLFWKITYAQSQNVFFEMRLTITHVKKHDRTQDNKK